MFTPRNDSPLKQIESKIIDHLELNVGLLIWTESITSDTFASYNMLYLVKLNKSNELDYYDVSELESRVDYETLKTDLIYQKRTGSETFEEIFLTCDSEFILRIFPEYTELIISFVKSAKK